jgi:hypothetical protein
MSSQIDKADHLGSLATHFVPGDLLPFRDRRSGRRGIEVGSCVSSRHDRVALRRETEDLVREDDG